MDRALSYQTTRQVMPLTTLKQYPHFYNSELVNTSGASLLRNVNGRPDQIPTLAPVGRGAIWTDYLWMPAVYHSPLRENIFIKLEKSNV